MIVTVLNSLTDFLRDLHRSIFGCNHAHTSFPITMRQGLPDGSLGPRETHVCCLDCARELPYDWAAMKIGGTSEAHSRPPAMLLTHVSIPPPKAPRSPLVSDKPTAQEIASQRLLEWRQKGTKHRRSNRSENRLQ